MKHFIRHAVLSGLALCSMSAAVWSDELRPENAPLAFAPEPGKEQTYAFLAPKNTPGRQYKWQLRDFSGKRILRSGEAAAAAGRITLTLTLDAGYYDLTFPETGQTFGIAVLPQSEKTPDPFFCIQGNLEKWPRPVGEGAVKMLLRHGIAFNREWTNFRDRNPQPDRYDDQYDPFYRMAGRAGMRSFFCIGDFPEWMNPLRIDKRPRHPGTLIGYEEALRRMIESRREGLAGFQALNETDSANVTAEMSAAVWKASAYAMRNDPEMTMAGSAFCTGGESAQLRAAVRDGALRFWDVFAFHSYAEPEKLVPLVAGYRNALRSSAKFRLPFWMTESGREWPLRKPGTRIPAARPGRIEDDLTSALWIVQKAVEAKACGVQRYFPFTLRYFPERDNNFGMMGRENTPLRSLAGYCFASVLLGGKSYRGDWKRLPPGLHSCRIFADDTDAVAVLYAGSAGIPELSVSVADFPDGEGFGLDGAGLKPENGKIKFSGGLAYWRFPRKRLTAAGLDSGTEAMKLLKLAQAYRPEKRVCTPLIYRYEAPRDAADIAARTWYLMPKDRKLRFLVANLSGETLETHPELTLPEGVEPADPLPEKLLLPPKSETVLEVTLKNSGLSEVEVRVGDAKDRLSATTVKLFDKKNLTRSQNIAWQDAGRWQKNCAGRQAFSFDAKEKALKIDNDFTDLKTGAAWTYPILSLLPGERKPGLKAISFEFRIDPAGKELLLRTPRVMRMQADRKYTAYPFPLSTRPPDSQWQSFEKILIFGDDSPFTGLGIGLIAPRGGKFTCYIRNVKLWY